MRYGINPQKVAIKDDCLLDCTFVNKAAILDMLSKNGLKADDAKFSLMKIDKNYFEPKWTDEEISKRFESFPAWMFSLIGSDKIGFYQMFSGYYFIIPPDIISCSEISQDIIKIRLVKTVFEKSNEIQEVIVYREYVHTSNGLQYAQDIVEKHLHSTMFFNSSGLSTRYDNVQINSLKVIPIDEIEIGHLGSNITAETLLFSAYDILHAQGYKATQAYHDKITIKPEYIYSCLNKSNHTHFFNDDIDAWKIIIEKNDRPFIGAYLPHGHLYIFPNHVIK